MRNVLGFHNPDEEYGFLSNWYLSEFTVDGTKFSSMEQYMMYKKAMLFQDNRTASEILNTQDVRQIKALGRQVKNYDDIMWNGRRQVIIYQGLLEKFCQNPKLKKKLLETGDDILAECAVRDIIWGIGLSMTDEKRFSLSHWRGQNLLGFALMEVREKNKFKQFVRENGDIEKKDLLEVAPFDRYGVVTSIAEESCVENLFS